MNPKSKISATRPGGPPPKNVGGQRRTRQRLVVGADPVGGHNPKSAAGSSTRLRALLGVVRWDKDGLVPAVIQDAKTRQVLTLCYLNQAALRKSLATGTVYLFRRSQRRLMQKGETSGHIQVIRDVLVDCEGKSLVLLVDQRVAACHAGYFTCYFRHLSPSGKLQLTGRKVFDPTQVYQRSS